MIEIINTPKFELEIILNSMGFDGKGVDYLMREIDLDYVIENKLKVGLKWEPSAVDWGQITFVISIIEDALTVIGALGIINKAIVETRKLFTTVLATKPKTEDEFVQPLILLEIKIDGLSIFIDGITEDTVKKITSTVINDYIEKTLISKTDGYKCLYELLDEDARLDVEKG